MMHRVTSIVATLILILLLNLPLISVAQTPVKAPKNPYSVDKDVQLGQQAAAEVERQLPLLRNPEIEEYVTRVGQRLAAAIPREFQQPAFRYSLKVVDARDINAFALPGGFSYINRGLIEAAKNEGELAGVIAHEFSHVALRHGTAQAAKAGKYSVLGALGQIAGAVIGGGVGGVVAQGSQVGVGAYFLRFSREYEKQADILGARIMANAGYDPHDLANMFRTIERESGGGGPQWLSSHPNPANRFEYINREADLLNVSDPIRNTSGFNRVRAILRDSPRSQSMEEIGRSRGNRQGGGRDNRQDGQGHARDGVDPPSSRFRGYNGGYFQLSVPENWRQVGSGNEMTFAPEGAYGDVNGRFVFTHGLMVGTTRVRGNLRQATDSFLNTLAQGNQSLRRQTAYQRGVVSSREALSVTLTNVSEATQGPEIVVVYTTMLSTGDLFYMVGVAPQNEYQYYRNVFQTVLTTIRLR